MYLGGLGRADLGKVASQVTERAERGLRETEAGERGSDLKKQKHRAMLAREGRLRR